MSALDPNPSGQCMCGCGQTTPVAVRSNTRDHAVRGKHRQYLPSHNGRHVERYKVEDRGFPTPCWIAQRSGGPWGHACLKAGGVVRGMHVVYYERKFGPVPAGHHVHHRCEHGACINPDHLVALSPAEHKRAHSRLTWDDVTDIRRRVQQGELQKALAVEYGISRQSVCDMVHQRTWREAV